MRAREFIFKEVELTEWLIRRRIGQVILTVSPHVQEQAYDRGIPWHYVERILDGVTQLPEEKIKEMQNFNNFYIRDDDTWAEVGCRLRVDPEHQLSYLYVNTVVRREPGTPRSKSIPTLVLPN